MHEAVQQFAAVWFALNLFGSSALFVGSSMLLKTWKDTQSILVLVAAFIALALANLLYANLLSHSFTRGYLLSVTTCLLLSLSAGHFIFQESLTLNRICAAVFLIAGAALMVFQPAAKG